MTGNLTLCYNVLLIASLTLSGLAMHVLARSVTGSDRAAVIAGLAWACWPYRTAHFLHLQLQSLYFLPLALLVLHRVAAARRWRDAVWLGAVGGAAGDLLGVLRRDDGDRDCGRPPLHWRGRRGSGAPAVTGRAWRWRR